MDEGGEGVENAELATLKVARFFDDYENWQSCFE